METLRITVAFLLAAPVWSTPGTLLCNRHSGSMPALSESQSQDKGSEMSDRQVLNALREHDYRAVGSVVDASPSLLTEIARALPQLDEEAREMAVGVVARGSSPDAAHLLLLLTADKSQAVSSSAANKLESSAALPSGRDILKAISRQSQPYIRGQLYLALGRTGESGTIDALRAQLHNEPDREAAQKGQVALVKLGAAAERDAFLGQVREAKPDDALRISDQLLYVGDPRLAKGLLPWFSDFHNVTRLGSDRQKSMARMSDIAVWTAHRLGVRFQVYPEYLTNYSDSIILAARSAVDSL